MFHVFFVKLLVCLQNEMVSTYSCYVIAAMVLFHFSKLYEKENYVLQYRDLRSFLKLGMKQKINTQGSRIEVTAMAKTRY